MTVSIGTCGWSYEEWGHGFYRGLPRRRWLEHYAAHFDAVEINATFYGSLKHETLRQWRTSTRAGFRFCIKASRYLTHIERLNVTADSMARLRRQADALEDKLAVVVWQLPHTLRRDERLLEKFAAKLDRWSRVRHAIEFRSGDWFHPDVARLLADHRIAIVQSHAPDWPMWECISSDLVYVRLHGGQRLYESAYATPTLRRWAAAIHDWADAGLAVHVYFDNTAQGHAVRNALKLRALVGIARDPEVH